MYQDNLKKLNIFRLKKKDNQLGLYGLLRDVISKTKSIFITLLGLTFINAFVDGLRIVSAFLILPFIGIEANNKLTDKGIILLKKFDIEYNITNVSIAICLVFILYTLINLTLAWYQAKFSQQYTLIWRKQLMSAFSRAQWRFYLDMPSSRLVSAITQECIRLQGASNRLANALGASMVILVYFGMALIADYKTTSILIFVGICVFILNNIINKPLLLRSRKVADGNRRMFLIATEYLRNIKIIKSVGRVKDVISSFNHVLKDISDNLRTNSFLPNAMRTLNELLTLISIILVIAIVVNYGINTSEDSILIILVLAIRIASKGTQVLMALQQSTANLASFETVSGVLQEANNALELDLDKPGIIFHRNNFRNNIHFHNVSIKHSETKALSNVTLEIPYGEIIGLAGPTGSGKTTLVDALLRLYPVNSGRITVDGRRLDEFDIKSWRQAIGYVPQDTTLLEGTVRENIKLLAPDTSDEDMIEAAKLASAHEFIMDQSNGYDTVVGNMGLKLSGGQRQRLALARALIRKPVLLIMDESTSSLDSVTEGKVMEDIYKLRHKMTIVIVAHRLGTIRLADRIYILKNGKLIETGSSDELLEKKGLFYEMWQRQVC